MIRNNLVVFGSKNSKTSEKDSKNLLWLEKNAWERLIGYGYRGMPARDWSAMVTKECLREIDISFNNLRCLGIVIFKRKYIE
jgi:hypothetical protein